MKIVNQSASKLVPFYEIKQGDIFQVNGTYYMKTATEHVERSFGREIDIVPVNAINLYKGSFVRFTLDSKVIPVDCELVIK